MNGSFWRITAAKLVFLVLGICLAIWAALVPFIKARLGVNESELGFFILLIGTGSLVSMPVSAALTVRFGVRAVLAASVIPSLVFLSVAACTSSKLLFGISLFLFGVASGLIDVAMNIQAVLCERETGRSLMSGIHAFFSVGGLAGGTVMAVFLKAGLSDTASCIIFCVIMAVAFLLFWPSYYTTGASDPRSRFGRPSGLVLLLGILLFILYLADGIVMDWAALLMTVEKNTLVESAGLAFAAYSAFMAAGRFFGERLIRFFGIYRMMAVSGIVAIGGFSVVIFAAGTYPVMAGFCVAGLGAANLIPALFSLAARQKTMKTEQAIACVTFFGYAGLILGPAAMGMVAFRFGLAAVFMALSAMLLFVTVTVAFLRKSI